MVEGKGQSAISLDFDGVLFPRPPAQAGGVVEWLQPWSYNNPFEPRHAPITMAERVPQPRKLSKREVREWRRHLSRDVKPEIAKLVKRTRADAIFGNTGRPNSIPMTALTYQKLDNAGITEYFEGIYFSPEGVSSEESKYWALKELIGMGFTDIVHYDDNARLVKRLASALPEVKFAIVQDLTSGILLSKMK